MDLHWLTQEQAYKGFYINLARNTDRNQQLQANLKDVGLDDWYFRYEAVDGRAAANTHPTKLDPGSLGCWLSHLEILQVHRHSAVDLHILEDDAVLSKNFARSFDSVRSYLNTRRDTWDLLLTEIFVQPDQSIYLPLAEKYKAYQERREIAFVSLCKVKFACTSSIFVNRLSIGKYLDLMIDGWRTGLPIDLYLRQLVHKGSLQAHVCLPFLTTVSDLSTKSDIRGSVDRTRAVLESLRRAFFVDADHAELLRKLQNLVEGSKNYPLDLVFLQTLQYVMSDQFEKF